jgi:hypothetical protein
VVLVCFVFLILKPGRAVPRYRPTGTAMIAGVDDSSALKDTFAEKRKYLLQPA